MFEKLKAWWNAPPAPPKTLEVGRSLVKVSMVDGTRYFFWVYGYWVHFVNQDCVTPSYRMIDAFVDDPDPLRVGPGRFVPRTQVLGYEVLRHEGYLDVERSWHLRYEVLNSKLAKSPA